MWASPFIHQHTSVFAQNNNNKNTVSHFTLSIFGDLKWMTKCHLALTSLFSTSIWSEKVWSLLNFPGIMWPWYGRLVWLLLLMFLLPYIANKNGHGCAREWAAQCERLAIRSQTGFSLWQMWDQRHMPARPKGWIGAEGGNYWTLQVPVCLCTLDPRASSWRNTKWWWWWSGVGGGQYAISSYHLCRTI